MKIKGTIAGDLEIASIKKYGESGTRMANIRLVVKVKEDEAKDKYGADFHRICFGAMTIRDGLSAFPFTSMKPDVRLEVHEMEILTHKSRVSPEITSITPVKDEPAVTMNLIIPLPCDDRQKKMIGDLAVNAGELVNATFEEVQMALPLAEEPSIRKKDGKFGNPKPIVV